MTIKAIKEKYKDTHKATGDNKTMFAVFSAFFETDEKFVVIVTDCDGFGKTVVQVVRVRDGAEMLPLGSCRPCDSLSDAVDVALEMEWKEAR